MAKKPKGWSITDLAKEFGRDRRTVAAAVATLKPIGKTGRSKLYSRDDAAPLLSGGGAPTRFDAAKARKMEAEAELAENEVRKARAAVVIIADAVKVLAEPLMAVRAKLLALPSKLAPTDPILRAMITAGVREVLNELVTDAKLVIDGDAEGGVDGSRRVDGAAAGADGERMGGLLSQAFL